MKYIHHPVYARTNPKRFSHGTAAAPPVKCRDERASLSSSHPADWLIYPETNYICFLFITTITTRMRCTYVLSKSGHMSNLSISGRYLCARIGCTTVPPPHLKTQSRPVDLHGHTPVPTRYSSRELITIIGLFPIPRRRFYVLFKRVKNMCKKIPCNYWKMKQTLLNFASIHQKKKKHIDIRDRILTLLFLTPFKITYKRIETFFFCPLAHNLHCHNRRTTYTHVH